MARAAAFYQALGFVLKFGGPAAPFTSFQVGSSYLNLTSMPTECEWSWWGRVIFYVDDVDAQCMQGLYQLASRPDSPRGMPHGANDISTWSIPTDTNSASRDRSDTLRSAAWRAGSRRARWSDSGTVKQQHREDDMAAGLISCDDHMDLGQLPADLWETRLPVALRDRSPHVEDRDGQAVWICDGKVWGRWDGKPPATGSARPIKPIYTALDRAGIHDNSARRPANANLRLADMDRDGVQTQLIFGPIFQISTDDPVLRASCYQVFNDWLLDFCAVAPDRLIGVPMLPENPQGALKELERLVARGGVRQVNLMIANVNPKLDDPAWEPLWNTLEASGIILAWHITVFVGRPGDRAAGKAASVFENTKFFLGNFLEPFVDLFAWGILERHPKLRVVMAEAGTGWLPWLVQELDYRHWRLWEAKEFWADKGGSALVTKPSELFQRQIYATFQEDYVALSLLPFFGEGHLLWASDYPHPDSVWPNSRDAIERQMHHLTPQMRRALTHDNAAALYGLA
jgi:predicted TIM-barrel fold metal-dependent hydrolase